MIQNRSGLLLIGLTGGIASGKSAVSEMMRELGSFIIDFDILAREVVMPGKPSYEYIVEYFGADILKSDNTVDRKQLSNIVFKNSEKRRRLEAFTHPFIWKEFIGQVKEISSGHKRAIVTAVIPLLIEGGKESIFDRIVLVYASPEIQIKRLMERDGITRQEALRILNAQMPIDAKIKKADFVIKNESTLEKTKKEVEALWKSLGEIIRV